jgi:hypothetical protein
MANILDRISKEQFDIAYDNHKPSGWIKFAYKYFSTETEKKDFGVKKIVVGVLGGLFGLGMLAAILNLSDKIIRIFVIPYSILLAVLVLYLFSAILLNNWRIKKIRKELGITQSEYDALVSAYY